MVISRARYLARRFIKPARSKPLLPDNVWGGPEDAPYTFVMVVREGFVAGKSNANSTIRMAYCRAFEKLGFRYRLVSSFDLGDILPETRNPFIFLSVYDYLDFGRVTRRNLRRYPHFVWANPDAPVLREVYSRHGIRPHLLPDSVYGIVSDSCPVFVWAPAPPSALGAYAKWARAGIPVRSLPQACDTERYYPAPEELDYRDVQLAFVGGYWPKKAVHFDTYLRPYEDLLTVFGYSKWPYKGYKGLLAEDDEKVLYQNARLCPAINEPHAETTGDIVERVYKIMGSGGLAITDAVHFHRELFSSDELLIPSSVEEYHEMVHQALLDDSLNRGYRARGFRAILARHTYSARAQTIARWLDISVPDASGHFQPASLNERATAIPPDSEMAVEEGR